MIKHRPYCWLTRRIISLTSVTIKTLLFIMGISYLHQKFNKLAKCKVDIQSLQSLLKPLQFKKVSQNNKAS
jgi:hypothetical protein